MVPMRDGVHLATDVYAPALDEPVPVVLQRLPYGKELGLSSPRSAPFFGPAMRS